MSDDLSFDYNEEDVNTKVDKALGKKLDEEAVEERIIKIQQIKSNPAEKDFMKTTLQEAEVKGSDEKFVVIKDEKGNELMNDDGEIILYDPIFQIDLKTLSDSQFADTESHVIPMLIDMAVNAAVNLKKAFKPELRKEPFNWWWIVFFALMIPGIVLIILLYI